MYPISVSGGYHFIYLLGGEHIARLVETLIKILL